MCCFFLVSAHEEHAMSWIKHCDRQTLLYSAHSSQMVYLKWDMSPPSKINKNNCIYFNLCSAFLVLVATWGMLKCFLAVIVNCCLNNPHHKKRVKRWIKNTQHSWYHLHFFKCKEVLVYSLLVNLICTMSEYFFNCQIAK